MTCLNIKRNAQWFRCHRHLEQGTTPNGAVGYAFDTASRRTSMSVTGTGTWSYSFDAGDRLTQIVNPLCVNIEGDISV